MVLLFERDPSFGPRESEELSLSGSQEQKSGALAYYYALLTKKG